METNRCGKTRKGKIKCYSFNGKKGSRKRRGRGEKTEERRGETKGMKLGNTISKRLKDEKEEEIWKMKGMGRKKRFKRSRMKRKEF